jgi:hypothetical protein
MPWAFAWLLMFAAATAAPPGANQIRCWVQQLASHDLAVCADASRQLLNAGDGAVEALLTTAATGDAAAALRATGILEQIAMHGNERTLRRVTAGLEELAQSGKPTFDGIIEQLQTRQARVQRERAVATIRSLGGSFESNENAPPLLVSKSASEIAGGQNALQPPPKITADQPVSGAQLPTIPGVGLIEEAYVSPEFFNGAESKEPELVLTIGQQWRGGDAGLAALLDLGSIVKLRLQRAPLTDAAIEQIAAISQLESVEFDDCHFSAAALNGLRQRQPRTQIVVHSK